MSKGINKVILVGNLGADPELRALDNGSVASLRVATNEKWKDRNGEMQERTEWHRVTLWGRLAEIAGEYLRKGSTVYIEGRIQTRQYEKDGETRYSTEIVAREMLMLGGSSGSGSGGKGGDGWAAPRQPKSATTEVADDFDDSIPF